jgi:hypothetical protein
MSKNKIGQLCYWLVRQAEGKELLDELRKGLANDPVFPKHPDLLSQYGGANNYAAFRAGESYLIRVIELHAKGYIDQENAAIAAKEKSDLAKAKKNKEQK